MEDSKRHSKTNSVHVNGSSGKVKESAAEANEIYKQIPEDLLILDQQKNNNHYTNHITKQETKLNGSKNNEMVQEDKSVLNDGADEQMLGAENDKLAEKRDEVKFIKADHHNGDAKIDIGVLNGKHFTGMTKEELMKYANDPFWVRLRWIFFIAFWAIWAAMLIGAILIIADAPKCAAPEPLPWYKRGLLAKFSNLELESTDLEAAQKIQASGVIYELPADKTYNVKDPEVEESVRSLVNAYKSADINVILDVTPNYVDKNSQLFKDALLDKTKRSAFIWMEQPEVPSNWLSIVNGSAWNEVQQGNFVLSQFGDGRFDLNMNDTVVKQTFGDVLRHLLSLGVHGFRLKNTQFFLLSAKIQNEEPLNNAAKFIHTQYGFWTHTQTTFQEGLGDLLHEYVLMVKTAAADAFLAVANDIVRPEVYQVSNHNSSAIDMPIYGHFTHLLSAPHGTKLRLELLNTLHRVANNTWLQWNMADVDDKSIVDPSALNLFVSLLPGVPVLSIDSPTFRNVSADVFKHIHQMRQSPSYMHGNFELHEANEIIAYSRIKSGNPGYFVAFNPTNMTRKADFSIMSLPDKMNVDYISDNYNVSGIIKKTKVATNSLELSPYSSIILTYVPVKSG